MVLDPLLSFFEFGRIRCVDVAPLHRVPYVRFGARTASRSTGDVDDADLLEAVRVWGIVSQGEGWGLSNVIPRPC
jgi:hypothetical protein